MSDFDACLRTSREPISDALCPGKQALKRDHARQVQCADEKRWSGSIDLDAALERRSQFAQSSRWDYGLGYIDPNGRECAVWVEVHSAETGEVSTVIAKLRWLRDFLQSHCPKLLELTQRGPEKTRFVWVASGRCNILPHSPQMRRLRSSGLDPPCQRLQLP
jgi:hypothetical protein